MTEHIVQPHGRLRHTPEDARQTAQDVCEQAANDCAAKLEAGDEKTRLMLFHAVRELLFNVTKHAGVKAADVQVQRDGDQIQIVVVDSGRGFDPLREDTLVDPVTGLGLFSIRNRLDLLGGRFEIDSGPGKGSRFTLRAPVGPSSLSDLDLRE